MANDNTDSNRSQVMNDGSGSTFDELFSIMANQRRRYVLYYLHDAARDTVEYNELTETIARWETPSGEDPPNDHLEALELELQHHHLPKLGDHGIIDYDSRSKMIRYGNDFSKQEWLEKTRREEFEDV
ncbi:DUF7344 domain-containing protein [Natrinema gelatinilyticum]|uniref:DUF7344 domain-containing protein n=1 Tax=Natrinema gelatinilyticum TaxID=2961571 RepID=UPI0020C42C16|nr:hypothetical protein [Natrinema gelatinilyticum]